MINVINKVSNIVKQLLCKHAEYIFAYQKFVQIKDLKQFKLLEVETCKDCGKERLVEII
jgi:hypothetical protein